MQKKVGHSTTYGHESNMEVDNIFKMEYELDQFLLYIIENCYKGELLFDTM